MAISLSGKEVTLNSCQSIFSVRMTEKGLRNLLNLVPQGKEGFIKGHSELNLVPGDLDSVQSPIFSIFPFLQTC